MKLEIILAAGIAALPWFSMNSHTEPTRLVFLAAAYALLVVLRHFRVIRMRGAEGLAGLTMLGVGWLQSFPAWSHSAEIGTYILCGTAVVALASYRAARRSQFAGHEQAN
jgi:hypothetical protein